MSYLKLLISVCLSLLFLVLSACGGGGGSSDTTPEVTYSIGGSVSGLTGTDLVLQNNLTDDLSINSDSNFTFATKLSDAANYSVSILSQPTGQTCSVINASGTLSASNITNVSVTCVNSIPGTYTIGGNVIGLAASGLVLQNNLGDDLSIINDGSYSFSTPLADASSYSVSVLSQPINPQQVCSITNATGAVSGSNVTNANVTCLTSTYTIGGNVTGLVGSSLVLQNNLGSSLTINSDGAFTMPSAVLNPSDYNITIASQPINPAQVCTVTNATGSVTGSNITDVQVQCTTTTYTVNVNVSGLNGSGLVLQNNGGDDLAISTNGSFTFSTPLIWADTYNVTALTQPSTPAQTCSVLGGDGTIISSNVDITVSCVNTYSVGLTVSGKDVASTDLVLVSNQGEEMLIPSDGVYTFSTQFPNFETFEVLLKNNPALPSQTCVINNGGGLVDNADITNVTVDCTTNAVQAKYVEGSGWNDYVNTISIVSACSPASISSSSLYGNCKHGGEIRTVDTGLGACAGLIAVDTLDAFNWVCDDTSGSAVFTSTSLKAGKYLSNLIDLPRFVWKTNRLNVSGAGNYTSPFEVWWPNAIIKNNTGGNLTEAGAVYVVSQDTTADYILSGSKASLVIAPGVTVTNAGSFDTIDVTGAFHWLEGTVNANDNGRAIAVQSSFTVLRGVTASNAVNSAISLYSSYANMLSDVVATDSISGVHLNSCKFNTLHNIRLSNNSTGLYISSSDNNTLTNSTSVNSVYGIRVQTSDGNMLSNVTAANNTYGVYFEGASTNTLHDAVLQNNQYGIYGMNGPFTLSENNLIYNIAASYNDYGIYWDMTNANQFARSIMVGNNITADCYVVNDSGDNGLYDDASQLETTHDGLCLPSASSTFTSATTGIDTVSSMPGKVTVDDVTNASDTNGLADHANVTDWGQFDNEYRLWGRDGVSFTAADSRLTCSASFACRIMDFSLTSTDTVLRNVNTVLANGNAINTEYYTRDAIVGSNFLLNAVELFHDGSGDEDGVCETNESCLVTPNLGSYQGHDALISAGTFTDGDTLSGITLWQYSVNGR